MKVLVVGKGGREHALVTAIHESPTATEIYAFPGSDAIFEIAKPAAADGLGSLVQFMVDEGIDLCVAGEESYLLQGEGLSDLCAANGIPCWGPSKRAANLEGSKAFAKDFMFRHGVPTGGYELTADAAAARAAITGYPTVLKFDGLAAGKGVAVCPDEASAHEFIGVVFDEKRFGPGSLVVEEFLEGPEVSVFVSVVDGDYQVLATARDYKRIGDGDAGPNTGGMGAVSSQGLLDPALLADIEERVVAPTVRGLVADDLPYRGFLYFGLMLTADGPKLLEYNCRFGDPECQAVMPMVSGDFAAYLAAAAGGELRPDLIEINPGWSVCVVQASAGYPASSHSGDRISGLEKATASGARVYHAGTKRGEGGDFETNGGRVLAAVATADTLAGARSAAYAAASEITFDGQQMRQDIATLHFEPQPEPANG